MSSLLISALGGSQALWPCRLCLKNPEGDNSSWSHLDRSLRIDSLKITTTLRTIVNSMRKTQVFDDTLPQNICNSCVDSVIQVYLFLRLCEESEKRWSKLANDLCKSTKAMEEYVKNKNDLEGNRNFVCVVKRRGCSGIVSSKGTTDIKKICKFLNLKIKPRNFKSDGVYTSNCTFDSSYESLQVSIHRTLNVYKCSICEETFNLASELQTHIKKAHVVSKENFQCPQCPEIFSRILDAKKHKLNIHNSGYRHMCKHCGKKYQSLARLLNHEGKHKDIVCDKCSQSIPYPYKLKSHLKRCTGRKMSPSIDNRQINETQYECETCNRKFSSSARLKYHISRHLGVVCEKCGRNFKYKSKLKAHSNLCQKDRKVGNPRSVEQPTGPPQFVCDHCANKFHLKETLKAHIKSQHLYQNMYKCSFCDKRFSYKSGLKSHLVVHTKARSQQCGICGKYFVTKQALVYHMRLHTGERPFPCDQCGERFLSASRKMSHVRKKHWGRTEECSVCFSKFFTPYAMRKHMSRHFNPNSKLFCNKLNDECVQYNVTSDQ